jgi:hypothetical protein
MDLVEEQKSPFAGEKIAGSQEHDPEIILYEQARSGSLRR